MRRTEIELLLAQMDYTHENGGWFTSVGRALEGLSAAEAAWSPDEGVNSIWQIVAHLTFWKQIVAGRLEGAPLTGTPIANDATFRLPARRTDDDWQAAVEQLRLAQTRFREQVAGRADADLDRPLSGETTPLRKLIAGMVLHDTYHLGQIILLRKQQGAWAGRRPGVGNHRPTSYPQPNRGTPFGPRSHGPRPLIDDGGDGGGDLPNEVRTHSCRSAGDTPVLLGQAAFY